MHVKRYCNIRDNYNFLGMAGQDVRGYMCLPRHVLKWPDIFISMYTHKTWSTVMHIEHMYMYVTHVLSILIVPEVENEIHASICLKTIATISSSLLLKSVVIKILYKWQHFNLPRKSFLWHVSIKLVKLLAESDVLFAGPISTSWRPIPKTMGIWRKGCSLLPSCSTHQISVSSVLEL